MIASSSASAQSSGVIAPYGGTLVDLMVATDQRVAVKASANQVLECSDRNACDVSCLWSVASRLSEVLCIRAITTLLYQVIALPLVIFLAYQS